jgi:hypothetical protein
MNFPLIQSFHKAEFPQPVLVKEKSKAAL